MTDERIIAVFLTSIMLLASFSGVVIAGANSTTTDGEKLHNQLQNVDGSPIPGNLINLTDSVNVWEGSMFSLRVDRSDDEAVATSVKNLESIAENNQGSEFLRINNLATYEEDATLDLTFDSDKVPGLTTELDGTDLHVVAAKAESTDEPEVPTSLDVETWRNFLKDGADREDVTFHDLGQKEITNGDVSFEFDLSKTDRGAGAYTFVAVRTVEGDGINIANGNLEIDGVVDILGSDAATAQQADSDITVDDTKEIGETIKFEVDPNLTTDEGKVEHAVALWDEDAVSDESMTIVAPDNLDRDTTLADFTIRHTIGEVSGVQNMEDGVSVFGQSLSANQNVGVFEPADMISFLASEGEFDEPQTVRDGDTTVYASTTSLKTDNDGTTVIEVETTEDFEPGEYVAVHTAMADDDLTKISSARTDISLVDEIEDSPEDGDPGGDDPVEDEPDDDPADPGAPPAAPPDDDEEDDQDEDDQDQDDQDQDEDDQDQDVPEPGELDDDEIDEVLDVPDDVRPTRAERSNIAFDAGVGISTATFSEESSIESVAINSEVDGSVSIGEYEREPAQTGPSPGATVSVTQITVPEGLEDTDGTVTTRIRLDRLEEIGATADNLQINRFTDGAWQSLETEVIGETETHVRIAADTPGFSFFSVSAVSEPTAAFDVNPVNPAVGDEVTLNASESEDQYGEIVSFDWNIAGESLTGETVTTTFEEGGEYEIELTVQNDAGENNTVTDTVTIAEPEPRFEIADLEAPAEAEFGDALDVTATITNIGDATGEVTVTYEFNGESQDEESVLLGADESETVTFSVTAPGVEGTYEHTVSLDNNTETVTTTVEQPPDDEPDDEDTSEEPIEEEDDDDDGVSLLLLFGVFVILVGGGAVIYLITQRQS